MIKIGEIIFVQTKGICKVENITKNAFEGCDKTKEYYVLKPVDVSNNMMVYFPTDTKLNMRALTSKTKAEKLLKELINISNIDIKEEEKRFEVYNKITQSGDLEDWCRLLKTLLERKRKIQKRQFNLQEQKYITTLTNCILTELSYVLSKEKDEIKSSLIDSLENIA
jgi:RNA polymerase-interacting CarD/CdnL/TRCF family regulator